MVDGQLPYGKCGKPRIRSPEATEEAAKAVAQEDCQTLRTLAAKKETQGSLKRIKPLLSDENKKKRLRFALGFLQPGLHGAHFFENMYNRVHVDEKWFYLTQVKRTLYVYEDEELALRSAKSTSFITKVMFLAAVTRPRYDAHTRQQFDGKLGIGPFVSYVAAARSSKNRPKGTIETVAKSMDSEAYRECIMRNIVPAILSKFPHAYLKRGVVIQQDNAGPHGCITSGFLSSEGFSNISI
ncbi:hypothetical protein Ae201684_010673 [Aphanomyces euteiches]|uniref:Uncharacterized protein n=1 Tax=Aphanomyces euteiches TaxID=100861 RepID=A0A6G0WXD8_9STRA|nr:hypothetical protein Ae201684_010673 [Aphanomyces euteiches]